MHAIAFPIFVVAAHAHTMATAHGLMVQDLALTVHVIAVVAMPARIAFAGSVQTKTMQSAVALAQHCAAVHACVGAVAEARPILGADADAVARKILVRQIDNTLCGCNRDRLCCCGHDCFRRSFGFFLFQRRGCDSRFVRSRVKKGRGRSNGYDVRQNG